MANVNEVRLIDRARIPGYIQTSGLTRAGEQSALYVATGGWAQWPAADGSG